MFKEDNTLHDKFLADVDRETDRRLGIIQQYLEATGEASQKPETRLLSSTETGEGSSGNRGYSDGEYTYYGRGEQNAEELESLGSNTTPNNSLVYDYYNRSGDNAEEPPIAGYPPMPNVAFDGAKAAEWVKAWYDIDETEAKDVIRDNKDYILDAAKEFGVDPQAVATVIYAEQVTNVNKRDDFTDWLAVLGIDTSVGVGQVKMSTAKSIEDAGYIVVAEPPGQNESSSDHLYSRLMDEETNIRYVAAYLKMIEDTWKEAYPQIADDPYILATLYQRGLTVTPHDAPKSSPFGVIAGDEYSVMENLLK